MRPKNVVYLASTSIAFLAAKFIEQKGEPATLSEIIAHYAAKGRRISPKRLTTALAQYASSNKAFIHTNRGTYDLVPEQKEYLEYLRKANALKTQE